MKIAKDKYERIGTLDFPLRASNIPKLMKCEKSFMIATLSGIESSNEYAETGTLTHAGIQGFHASGEDINGGMALIAMNKSKCPLGDSNLAADWLRKYVERERNDRKGVVLKEYLEHEFTLVLPPAKIDKTKKDIYITGHIDMIRKEGDYYLVIDHKTGYPKAEDMIRDHASQLAMYMLGAYQKLKTDKIKSYITRIQDLHSRSNPFYWETRLTIDRCNAIVEMVKTKIALIRMGLATTTPGKHCDYCFDERYYPNCIDNIGLKRAVDSHHKPSKILPRVELKTIDELFKT